MFRVMFLFLIMFSCVCFFLESIAFEFSNTGGLIIYSYPEDRRPDAKSDILAFSLIAVQENAHLIRVTSASSTDYLQLKLVIFF